MQAMYDLVGDKIQEIFDAQVVDIGIYDSDAGLIRFPYTIERGVRFPDEPIELDRAPKHVIETRGPLINDDIDASQADGSVSRSSDRRAAAIGALRATDRWRRGVAASSRSRTSIARTPSRSRTCGC